MMIPIAKPSHGHFARMGVRVSQLRSLCAAGSCPVLHLDHAGCLALREAFASALLLCFLPGKMEAIVEKSQSRVLKPETVDLIKLTRRDDLFDEVILVQSYSAAIARLCKVWL